MSLTLLALLAAAVSAVGLATPALASDEHPRSDAQQFQIFSNDQDDDNLPVAATGVINARGVDHVINDRTDLFIFRQGSLLVRHRMVSTAQHLNRDTCVGTFAERGVWRIIDGTHRYDDVTGRGTYLARGLFILPVSERSGRCERDEDPVLFRLTITAAGTVDDGRRL